MKRSTISVAVIATLALGLVATNAGASYDMLITRTVCPAGAFVPNGNHHGGNYHVNTQCGLTVSGLASGVKAYGVISIPFEAKDDQIPVWSIGVHGANVDSHEEICLQAFAFDSSGDVTGMGSDVCTTNSTYAGMVQTVTGTSVVTDGAILCNVAAMNGATLDSANVTFSAGGT
jgi:hypothetical protein